MSTAIHIANVSKTYQSGQMALAELSLEIRKGEIFALLGPNGAGKSTLINIVCGIATPSTGRILADGHDITREYRQARSKIGLVPQEIASDVFESVWSTVRFSRGLFGKPADDAYLERMLRELALWEKRDARIFQLSGGMKRRVMIAKALSHQPEILFLDEPTAGVDVELRREMWAMVRRLRDNGVTIVLTTHYLEEAEDLADRIGIINAGRLILVEEKSRLMQQLGKKQLVARFKEPLTSPPTISHGSLELRNENCELVYTYDSAQPANGIATLLRKLDELGAEIEDIQTQESSLEDIFVSLVSDRAPTEPPSQAGGAQ